jgi:RNA polymerase sigma-70 factor (ECF subfamily)
LRASQIKESTAGPRDISERKEKHRGHRHHVGEMRVNPISAFSPHFSVSSVVSVGSLLLFVRISEFIATNCIGMQATNVSPALRWLEEHGDALYAFALPRVRNADVAEDLVQETLLAGVAGQQRFAGKSAERTWLMGILKHKLIDHLRKSIRQRPLSELDVDISSEFFTDHGQWRVSSPMWEGRPEAALEQEEFRQVLSRCLSKLPSRLAQLFWLREAEDVSTEQLCQELGITATNVWTMLHRARLGLRRCLNENWFESGDK